MELAKERWASGLCIFGFTGEDTYAIFETDMVKPAIRFVFSLLFAVLGLSTSAADTNSLVWHKTADRVDADIRGEPLWPLLETIARETGWRIYVEPGTTRNASAKFKNLPSGDALRMLLGDLNFALRAADERRIATLCLPHRDAKRHAAGARGERAGQTRSQ